MSENLGEAIVQIRADLTELKSGMDKAKKITADGTDSIGRSAGNATGKFSGLKTAVGGFGAVAAGAVVAGVAAAGAAMIAAGGAAISMGADLQKQEAAFETLLGSSDKAQAHMKELYDFARSSPFSIQGINDASIKMQSFGFNAEEVVPILKNVGDQVSAVGGGQEEMDGIVNALGQMKAKGKASTEELLQLTERGVPAFEILGEKFNMTGEQLETALRNGSIGADEAISALTEGMGEKFGGAMEKVNQTTAGAFDNFKETATGALATIGASVLENMEGKLVPAFNKGSEIIDSFTESLKENEGDVSQAFLDMMPEELKNFINDQLVPTFNKIKDTVDVVVGYVAPLWQKMQTDTADSFGLIIESISGVMTEIKETISVVLDAVQALWKRYGDNIVSILTASWDLIKSIFDTAVKLISNTLEVFLNLLQGDWKAAWDGIKKNYEIVWNGIKDITDKALKLIAEVLEYTWKLIKDATKLVWDGIKLFIENTWGKIFEAIGKALSKIGEAIKTGFTNGYNTVKTLLGNLATAVSKKFTEIKDTIKNKITDAWDNVKTGFTNMVKDGSKKIKELASTVATKAGEMAESFGSTFKETIASGIKGALNALIDTVNSGIRKVNGMITSFNEKSPIDASTIPEIPRLARGGTLLSSGLAMVGERGPELLQLPQGARVMPLTGNQRSMGASGKGNPIQLIQHFTTGVTEEAIQQGTERALRKLALTTDFYTV